MFKYFYFRTLQISCVANFVLDYAELGLMVNKYLINKSVMHIDSLCK